MSADVKPLRPVEPLAVDGERLVIRDFAVDGGALAATSAQAVCDWGAGPQGDGA